MTMFSMKPKFDLAEFLAVPAPVGARVRGAKRRGMQFQPGATPKDATKATSPEGPGSTDKRKK
ncbi:MAG: hypothetical protein WCD16_10955 [Paracoccaceae bacterium]